MHPAFGGRNLLRVNLDHVATVDAYLETIAAYAAANPDEPWITGGGWAMYLFPGGAPHKEELDRIVADRPVFLMNRDVHGAWVNSRALEIAGITKDTPDPWDGRIERDPMTGEPTGTLHEGAAYTFRDRFVPRTDQAEWRRALLVAQERLHALGITGWQDAWVTPDILEAYGALDDGRRAHDARHREPLVGPASRARSRSTNWSSAVAPRRTGHVRATTVKIMTDGVVENCSCSLLEPYGDPGAYPAGHRGLAYVGGERLRSAVVALDAQGSRCTCTPSAIARVVRRWMRSRPLVRRTVRATTGTMWRICRSCIPTTSRGSARSASSRTSSRCGRATIRR